MQLSSPIVVGEALRKLKEIGVAGNQRLGSISTILFVGDPHFKKDNVLQTERYVEETLRVFRECPTDTVCLLAGDVLDSHGVLHLNPLRRATSFIQQLLEIGRVIVLVGNHDMINNQEYLSEYNWMSAVLEPLARLDERLTVVTKPIMVDDLVFTPYVPTGRLVEALDTTLSAEVWKTARCVFGHQEIRGCYNNSICSASGGILDKSDIWRPEYPPLVSGHIHTPTFVGTNVVYPGSVIAHSFGESGQSAVHLVIPALSGRGLQDSGRTQAPVIIPIRISVPRRRTTVLQLEDIISCETSAYSKIRPTDGLEKVRARIVLPNPASAADPRLKRFVKSVPTNVTINLVVDPTYQQRRIESNKNTSSTDKERQRYLSFEENLLEAAKEQGQEVLDYVMSNME